MKMHKQRLNAFKDGYFNNKNNKINVSLEYITEFISLKLYKHFVSRLVFLTILYNTCYVSYLYVIKKFCLIFSFYIKNYLQRYFFPVVYIVTIGIRLLYIFTNKMCAFTLCD